MAQYRQKPQKLSLDLQPIISQNVAEITVAFSVHK